MPGPLAYLSGRWRGWYNHEESPRRRSMCLFLSFGERTISGHGVDAVGQFVAVGRIVPSSGACHFAKCYIGGPSVIFYVGVLERGTIFGAWELDGGAGRAPNAGAFRIWPAALTRVRPRPQQPAETRPGQASAAPSPPPPAPEAETVDPLDLVPLEDFLRQVDPNYADDATNNAE